MERSLLLRAKWTYVGGLWKDVSRDPNPLIMSDRACPPSLLLQPGLHPRRVRQGAPVWERELAVTASQPCWKELKKELGEVSAGPKNR